MLCWMRRLRTGPQNSVSSTIITILWSLFSHLATSSLLQHLQHDIVKWSQSCNLLRWLPTSKVNWEAIRTCTLLQLLVLFLQRIPWVSRQLPSCTKLQQQQPPPPCLRCTTCLLLPTLSADLPASCLREAFRDCELQFLTGFLIAPARWKLAGSPKP